MKNQIYEPHKSSIGNIDANIIALIAYFATFIVNFIPVLQYFSWLAPLVIYFIEKDSMHVKFHAMQSFILNVAGAILGVLLVVVPSIFIGGGALTGSAGLAIGGGLIGVLAGFAIVVLVLIFGIMAMIGAYKYKQTHIPFVGEIVEKIV